MADPGRDRQALGHEPPAGACSRKAWQPGMLGWRCYAALANGEGCGGVFRDGQP